MRQTFGHVNYLPNKPKIKDKIEPVSFQRVGHENGQPRVTKLMRFIL
jgi:hypothetical protein